MGAQEVLSDSKLVAPVHVEIISPGESGSEASAPSGGQGPAQLVAACRTRVLPHPKKYLLGPWILLLICVSFLKFFLEFHEHGGNSEVGEFLKEDRRESLARSTLEWKSCISQAFGCAFAAGEILPYMNFFINLG